jgi:acyl CoA:acetate/3-ketoacid CoA transferase alpha subunit
MVARRRTMRDCTKKMQQGKPGRMMEHIQAGKDSIGMCPAMTQLGGTMHRADRPVTRVATIVLTAAREAGTW